MTERITFKELVKILDLIYQSGDADLLDVEDKLNKLYENLKKPGNYINDLIIVESKTKIL